jgi:hypothetical protein
MEQENPRPGQASQQPPVTVVNIQQQSYPGSTMGTVSLIFGIIGLVTICGSVIFSPLGLIFGIIAYSTLKKNGGPIGVPTWGIVLSAIPVALEAIALVIMLVMGVSMAALVPSFVKEAQQQEQQRQQQRPRSSAMQTIMAEPVTELRF